MVEPNEKHSQQQETVFRKVLNVIKDIRRTNNEKVTSEVICNHLRQEYENLDLERTKDILSSMEDLNVITNVGKKKKRKKKKTCSIINEEVLEEAMNRHVEMSEDIEQTNTNNVEDLLAESSETSVDVFENEDKKGLEDTTAERFAEHAENTCDVVSCDVNVEAGLDGVVGCVDFEQEFNSSRFQESLAKVVIRDIMGQVDNALQNALANNVGHERLVKHLEGEIKYLRKQLEEKDMLINAVVVEKKSQDIRKQL